MVGPGEEASTRPEPGWKPAKEVKDQLIATTRDKTCLMQHNAYTAPKITQAGFQFLLRPLRAQVWQLLMDIVNRRREKEANKADELLATVFQLSFCTLGASYPLDGLSKTQQVAIHPPLLYAPPPRGWLVALFFLLLPNLVLARLVSVSPSF